MYHCQKRGGFIYFVQEQELLRIKIGFTSGSPLRRVHKLRNASSQRLEIIGIEVGSIDYEKKLHRRFSHMRERNEWFRPERELIEYVNDLLYGTEFEKALWAMVTAEPRFAMNTANNNSFLTRS